MRHIAVIVTALLTVTLTTSAWATGGEGQGKNNANKSRGGSTLERQVYIETKYINIQATESRRFGIEWVVLADGQSTIVADARNNVTRDDQDRVNLSFIPLLSQIVGTRYTGDDISPQTRVGSAWVIQNILLIALDGNRTNILAPPKLVVLNNKWAFTLENPALPIDWQNNTDLAAINEIPPIRDFAMSKVVRPEVQSVLIGGLDTQQKTDAASRVPVLSGIPGLGDFFVGSAHQRRKAEKTELILFIKPFIVKPAE